MKYRFHIHFADNSNPYFSFDMGANEIVKAVNKWVKTGKYNFNNKYIIFDFDHNFRISSTHRGTWVIYKKGKYIDTPLNEYRWLGKAMKFLEKEIQKRGLTNHFPYDNIKSTQRKIERRLKL